MTDRPAGESEAASTVITLDDNADFPARVRGAFVAVGNFDGVHRGHARLMARLRARADAAGAPALALTFDPPPVVLLRPDAAPAPLTWPERRDALLVEVGATEVGVFRTGPWLLNLTAREFFDQVIRDRIGARGMVEGPTFGFGRDRGGNSATLAAWCAAAGLDFEVAPPDEADGQIISSSRIRRAIAEGAVAEAAAWLGRPHRIRGIVTHGAGRGAGIGVPTANLDAIDTMIPAEGVYAAVAHLGRSDQPPRAVACNIGPNPTFGEQTHKVEAHLIDFAGDLYGQTIVLDFVERIRPTRRFAGLDDLLGQIARDVDQARRACARAGVG